MYQNFGINYKFDTVGSRIAAWPLSSAKLLKFSLQIDSRHEKFKDKLPYNPLKLGSKFIVKMLLQILRAWAARLLRDSLHGHLVQVHPWSITGCSQITIKVGTFGMKYLCRNQMAFNSNSHSMTRFQIISIMSENKSKHDGALTLNLHKKVTHLSFLN